MQVNVFLTYEFIKGAELREGAINNTIKTAHEYINMYDKKLIFYDFDTYYGWHQMLVKFCYFKTMKKHCII